MAAKNRRQLFPRLPERRVRACAHAMQARRVADEPFRRIQPRLPGDGMEWRGRVVVEVEHGYLPLAA